MASSAKMKLIDKTRNFEVARFYDKLFDSRNLNFKLKTPSSVQNQIKVEHYLSTMPLEIKPWGFNDPKFSLLFIILPF